MKQLNRQEIQRLGIFNDKLKLLEEKIYNLALIQNQIALQKVLDKENDIYDYDIDITYYVYGDEYIGEEDKDEEDEDYIEHLLATWTDGLKLFMKATWWGVHDNNCHNVTSAFQKDKELNSQKHCWILHSLYDHNPLDWSDIFMIDTIDFNLEIKYEYLIKIRA